MIDTLMAVAGAIILYIQNSKLFFITIIMIVLYAVIVLGFNKWYEKLNRKEMEDNAQLTSYMVESLNGIQTVKAYNAERKVNRETEIKFVKLLRSVFNLTWANNIQVSLKLRRTHRWCSYPVGRRCQCYKRRHDNRCTYYI